MKTLPSQGIGASSQHRFHESLRFPHLHSETRFVIVETKEEETSRERERKSSTLCMNVIIVIFFGEER